MSMEPNVPSNSFARHSQPSPGANSMSSSMATSPDTRPNSCAVTPEYYQELLKDKRSLQSFPNVFHHVERILETEIGRARSLLYHQNGSYSRRPADDLPEGEGPMVTVQEKVYIPVKENPNYNFVGRLLGPRGMTAKQLETDLDCKIMIRGKGSMRDKKKEDLNRGKPNWEHLSEDLHVLVSVEDHQNRAELKAKRAADEIRVFLEQAVKMQQTGEDSAKRYQLAELAVLKGSYRPSPGQQGARVLNCLQLSGQLQATRASNAANALSMAAAAAAAAQQQQQQQQLNPASFFRLPTSASAAVGLQQQQLAAQQFLLQQGQSQQQLFSGLSFLQPAVSATGPGGADLSAYLMAAAAAAATSTSSGASTGVGGSVDPSASIMSSLMYPGGPAAAAGLDLGGQTGPIKGRQHLGSGSGGSGGVRNHPYTRPGF